MRLVIFNELVAVLRFSESFGSHSNTILNREFFCKVLQRLQFFKAFTLNPFCKVVLLNEENLFCFLNVVFDNLVGLGVDVRDLEFDGAGANIVHGSPLNR